LSKHEEAMIPRLETERLTLREYRPEDFEAFAAIMADPEVARYLPGGKPMSRMETWRFVAACIGVWTLRGYGAWAVERKSDGAMMGRIGLIHPEGWPGLEVGWTLGRPYWGRGYATEAAEASLRYAFLTQPVEEIISTIHPENLASQAVARKIGESKVRRTDIQIGEHLYTCDIWAITRAEWLRRTASRA
jgi:RimJ/RimL family protein N-acetyltransferase